MAGVRCSNRFANDISAASALIPASHVTPSSQSEIAMQKKTILMLEQNIKALGSNPTLFIKLECLYVICKYSDSAGDGPAHST